MSDWAHIKTDEALEELEKRIRKLYSGAAEELQGKIDDYFAALADRDEKQKALLKDGKITPQQYKRWRLNQIARGKRYEALRDDIAQRMNQANQAAFAYINDTTPGIYTLNHNYAAYEIEQVCGNVGFTLYDEQTVRRLVADDPELFPAPRIDIPKDLRWNRQRIATELTSGILQGESIGKIATRFQHVTDMNRTAAVRNARTAYTGAQNAGRLESYNRAKALGIEVEKEWLATLDKRTRHSHAALDGEAVATDKKFSNGCRFPGDPQGPPREVYNCRCTLVASLPDVDTSDAQRRARDPITGQSELLPSDMTYQEWVDWKKQSAKEKNAVAKSSKYAIIKNVDSEIYEINKESIDSIPKMLFPGLTDEASRLLHKQQQMLLQEAMKTPVGTEVAFICDLDGVRRWESVGMRGKASIPQVPYEHLILHNHPDCRIFSGTDIEALIMRPETKGIFAIGNNGTVYSAIKQEDYDGFAAFMSFRTLNVELEEYVSSKDVDGYVSAIRKYLKEARRFGIEFNERTAERA